MAAGRFGTAVNCMDGRVQEPVLAWLKERYELEHVDMITEAGPDKALAAEPGDRRCRPSRLRRQSGVQGSALPTH